MDGLNGGLSVDQDRGGPDESRTERRRSYSIGYSPVLPEAQTATRLIYALRVASRTSTAVGASPDNVRQRVHRSMDDRSLGCSIGCSKCQLLLCALGGLARSMFWAVVAGAWLVCRAD